MTFYYISSLKFYRVRKTYRSKNLGVDILEILLKFKKSILIETWTKYFVFALQMTKNAF